MSTASSLGKFCIFPLLRTNYLDHQEWIKQLCCINHQLYFTTWRSILTVLSGDWSAITEDNSSVLVPHSQLSSFIFLSHQTCLTLAAQLWAARANLCPLHSHCSSRVCFALALLSCLAKENKRLLSYLFLIFMLLCWLWECKEAWVCWEIICRYSKYLEDVNRSMVRAFLPMD